MAILRSAGGFLAVLVVVIGISWAVTAPGADMRGHWATQGDGLQLDIGRIWIDVYEVTAVSCTRSRRIPAHLGLIGALEDVNLTRTGAQLRIDLGGRVDPIMADQIPALSPTCPATPAPPGTAQENFDVLWQVMAENYAFFDLHGVDWTARRTALRPKDDVTLNEADLAALFRTTLQGLDDRQLHVLTTTGDYISPAVRPAWFDERHLLRDTTLGRFGGALTAVQDSGLVYGWATDDIGYVYLAHLDADPGFNGTGAAVAQVAFSAVAADLAGARGIIVDLRYTPGGSDDVALAYASYFTETPMDAFTKSTRTVTGYTPSFAATVTPSGAFTLTQPVIVLTSGLTAGAAEVFALTLLQMPQVALMGEPTSGNLSAIGAFTLPNGWELGLSHQRYLSPDGTSYEGTGMLPDLPFAVDVAAAQAGADTMLDAAVIQLRSGSQ